MLRAWPRKQRPEAAAQHGASAWLGAPRADFWVVAAGGGTLLIALALVLQWRGDRELSAADVLLGELHLGATYEAIVRRRLWRRMPLEVLAMPLAIMAATYLLMLTGGSLLVTTAVLCVGAWHRGRQNLGIARYYQRHAGGPVSPGTAGRSGSAFYLRMIAAVAYYASIAPTHEGEDSTVSRSLRAPVGPRGRGRDRRRSRTSAGRSGEPCHPDGAPPLVHPGERWLVLADALGFGSAYVLGAWTSSFVLVLAIHHEVQYLYFTYAVARQADGFPGPGGRPGSTPARAVRAVAGDRLHVLGPVPGGRASTCSCPFLTAGLLGHYWLDGRIWTARARSLGSR